MLSSREARLRRTAFLTIMLVLFSILFIHFAAATGENLSISGTKFLDLSSNGKKEPSEPGLPKYVIYLDKDNNTRWDATEKNTLTDESGMYKFDNLSSGLYIVRELVSSGDKLQPSSPQNGYYSVNLTEKSVTGKDFGNSIPVTAEERKSSDTDTAIYILFGIFALLLIGAGLVILNKGRKELNSLDGKQKDDKKTKIQILVASGFLLLLLGSYLLISLLQLSRNITGAETIIMGNSFALVTPVVLTLLVFGAVLLMLWAQNKLKQKDETGGMRKTIAGLLVVGLIAVVLFALSGTIQSENQNIITQYIQLVGIVIAFYFGTRATEDAYKGSSAGAGKADAGKADEDLDIESVTYNTKNGTIEMSISNSKKRNFTLKGVSIKDENTELFTYTYPESGMPASESSNPYYTSPLSVGDKKSVMDGLDFDKKEYSITIDTSIGPKSVTRKIVKKS